ncbi:type VII secretion integral membrane protein EccD [Auraticoccus sp. F435]|uniref:Type VII secretion integral membrane protein EccD n=1 Tax=Auraticoccus cholistanensis TaxID=2656650 RepID=A0A6A9V018_9ACTN|nr:type VII secretion integral membrane protein EccD [Auraticoccus cholistanensis]
MSTGVGEDLARVTVISPTRRIDLALPGSATIGEVLPHVVRFSGHEGSTTGDPVHSWVLQRLGEDPFDPTRLVSALGIRDGEVLHLRQRQAAMPDAAFDDVVDAVATSTNTQPSWRPAHSRRMALAVLGLVLIGTPLVIVLHRPELPVSLAALGLAVASGLASILLSRAFDRAVVAHALAWFAVGLSALAGWFLLGSEDVGLRALVACALVLVAAGTMAVGTGVRSHVFAAVAVTALVLILVAMAVVLLPGRPVEVCAVAVAVLLGVTPWLPGLCYRLARVAMPNLPTSAEELARDDQPVQSDIVARAVAADRLLAGLLFATCAGATVLSLVLVLDGRWSALALTGACGLALLLRARAFVGLAQRLVVLLSGLAVTAMTLVRLALGVEDGVLLLAVGMVLVVALAVALGYYAAQAYNRFVSPVWGRTGDILEWLAVMAVVPLVLAVLDLYDLVRGLGGA